MLVPVFLPHLGCGERCSYCNQSFITDLSDDNLRRVIEKNLGAHEGPVEVGLFGGNLSGLGPRRLENVFSHFSDYRRKITNFRVSTKPTGLTDETLEIFRANNVTIVEMGIPTFDDDILRALNRHHTIEDVEGACVRLKDAGFAVALQVMTGLPGETRDHVRRTAENIIRLRPDYIRIYPLVVFDGTPLGEAYRKGDFTPAPFEEVLDRTLFIYLSALKAGIKTVKMGLTDNEVIKEKIIGGHYHSAFGYMVRAKAFYLAVRCALKNVPSPTEVVVELNNKDIPHLVGERRENIIRFSEEGYAIKWEVQDMEQGSFKLRYGSNHVVGSVLEALSTF